MRYMQATAITYRIGVIAARQIVLGRRRIAANNFLGFFALSLAPYDLEYFDWLMLGPCSGCSHNHYFSSPRQQVLSRFLRVFCT